MKVRYAGIAAFIIASTASAAEDEFRPLSGSIAIYGGGLGDTQEPQPGDAKASIWIRGEEAARIFSLMGTESEVENICNPSAVLRVQQSLECWNESGDFTCAFGIDLSTGQSIGGSIC